MPNLMIKVENVSKRYRLGAMQTAHQTLGEALTDAFKAVVRRRNNGGGHRKDNLVWALNDVSFEVSPGEVVGIIGRNGAGKSTLLKILSRITEPTGGRVELYGRVGSLLEVGTGFHHELTGRENVFLNGAIIGMGREEIKRKFDEIVAFAEIDKFLDTPVKRYSSGMYLRLAFAVAAHLETEIVLLDEVLAVGDAKFQQKCISKMRAISQAGRTVIFVSHNVHAIAHTCRRAILIEGGQIVADASASQVISQYMAGDSAVVTTRRWDTLENSPGNEIVRLRSIRVCDQPGSPAGRFEVDKPIGIELVYDVLAGGIKLTPNLHFYSEDGEILFVAADIAPEWHRVLREPGRYVTTAWLPEDLLVESVITVGAAISTPHPFVEYFIEKNLISFQVSESSTGGGVRGDYTGKFPGVIRPRLKWQTCREEAPTS